MRRSGWAFSVSLVIVLATACGRAEQPPSVKPLSPWASGSRLRAMLYDGGDGALRFRGWFDSKLEMPCSFMTAHDGKLRCLPAASSDDGYFTDATCTEPVYKTVNICGGTAAPMVSAPIGSPPSGGTCASQSFAVYKLSSASAPSALYANIGGSCKSVPILNGDMTQSASAEVDPSSFVAGTTKLLPSGDGSLAAHVIVADDGASQVISLADENRGFDCEDCLLQGCLTNLGDLLHRCAPVGFAFGFRGNGQDHYSDAACSTEVDLVPVDTSGMSQCAPLNGYALVGDGVSGGSCMPSYSWEIDRVGDLFSGTAYSLSSMQCSASAPMNSTAYHALGPMVPASSFLSVRIVSSGKGRLQSPALGDANGHALLQTGALHDAQTNSDCSPVKFASGLFCVPDGLDATGLYFLDAACTMPATSEGGPKTCSAAPSVLVFGTIPSACAPTNIAYAVGAPIQASVAYQQTLDQGCVKVSFNPPPLWALTEVDPATQWAGITERTE